MILPFQYTYLLWLLIFLPVITGIYFYARKKRKVAFQKMGDPLLVKELTANFNTSSPYKKFLLLFFAMALIIVSLANFRSPKGSEKITRNGIDVMIALDVSNSMLAQDITPNRLERAKQFLNKLIDKLDNDRIGIVVFAGKAYLQMPLTGDHSAAKMYLSAATPQTIPTQGTVISEALKMCYSSFNSKEKKYKTVVLISDGEDHEENALKVAEEMAQQGVVINTIGMGTPEGAPIMDPVTNELKKDEQGITVITKLNEQALADIAKKGNGDYKLFSNTDAVVNALYTNLSTMDKRTVIDDSLVNYKSWFQILLGAALLFLIIELFVAEVKKVRTQSKKLMAVTNNGQSTQSLQLIDVQTEKILDNIEIAKSWLGLQFSSDEKYLYTSGGNDNWILQYAILKNKLQLKDSILLGAKWPNKISPAGIAIDDAKHLLYVVTKDNNSLYLINLTTKKIIQQIKLPAEAYTCLLSPNKKELYISCWGCDKILIFDTQKNSIRTEIAVGDNPNDICRTANGKYLFVAGSNTK